MNRNVVPALFLVCLLIGAPLTSQAQSFSNLTYDRMTVNEKIAFLYGMVAQLELIIEMRLRAEDDNRDVGWSRSADIETLSATDIEDDEAVLRADVELGSNDRVRVWFSYGETRSDLDERSSYRTVRDSRGSDQRVEILIDDLDEDERYYYQAVVEDEDDDREYGRIRDFTTDDERSSSGDYELSVDDRTIDPGDRVEVEWEIPRSDRGSQNWIGLYEVGDSNRDFVSWEYIDNDDEGSEAKIITSGVLLHHVY